MSIYNRFNPYIVRIKERTLLTKPGSTKQTYHIVLDVFDPNLVFQPGDSLAILPENAPHLIENILQATGHLGCTHIICPKTKQELSLYKFLQTRANLSKVHPRFLRLLSQEEDKEKLQQLTNEHTVWTFLRRFLHQSLSAQELVDHLMPLTPRFYSIASSTKMFPSEIHLTVSFVSYVVEEEERYGVASYFLCKQASIESTPISVYVQPSNHFYLPEPDASIILIGPGTGVAPFRAFLQERLIQNAPGRNWLFFGERHRATDFYYESFFLELVKQNFLRLDTAFSRDQKEKIYVHHKMREHAAHLWDWIQNGAFLYVCGDAEKMAKDVERSLQQIISEEASLSQEEARLYLRNLKAQKRYLLDVY